MIRLILAGLFLALAVFIFFSEVLGFYKFRYVMNRMHAAAMGDTLGIGSVLIAVAILTGELVSILKLALILLFMFLTGPVVTHLIAGAEVAAHRNAGHEYQEVDRR
ncbi:MAG: monovalent cation/H(+) antiporter subunit G [Oscillospiraceae bacterium]|nr:monovalent cation/H(+) antiporter subunit G [Oscillospiraceae bacterium]